MPWQSNMPAGEAYARARAAAEKALELDDALAEAHSALGSVKVYADWDWSGAEREFQKAIALNPNSAMAHAEYGHKVLSAVMGRYDDALVEMHRAQELDPLSVPISTRIGYVYYHARRWDQSIGQFQKTLELGSKSSQPYIGLGQNYVQMGRYEEALAELDEAAALAGDVNWVKGVRGWVLGLAGRIDEARQVLGELQETAAGRRSIRWRSPTSIWAWASAIERSRGCARPTRSARRRWSSCGRQLGMACVPSRRSSS